MYSLWIRIPAYIIGVIIFGGLIIYVAPILLDNERKDEEGKKNKRSNWIVCL